MTAEESAETNAGNKAPSFMESGRKKRLAFRSYTLRSPAPRARMIAYDFETTNIKAGTPIPLYLTIYSQADGIEFASPIENSADLLAMIKAQFLRYDLIGVKYVAWNANNFDAYFIAAAILNDPYYIIRPYLTKNNQLRGMRVMPREDLLKEPAKQRSWEFLDGIAMLGVAGVSLDAFTANFAPEHKKMKDAINFAKEQFDSNNPIHCMYAMRDSVGLWHGMQRAQEILYTQFGQPLTVTMGNACIKIFQKYLEDDVAIYPLAKTNQPQDQHVLHLFRTYLVRGGFCHSVRPFEGKVWKYDLNQAYSAAMRDAKLPCGDMVHIKSGVHILAKIKPYVARVTAFKKNNIIPFYAKIDTGKRIEARYCDTEIPMTWLTDIEINQLKSEGWAVTIYESYMWNDSFNMKRFVDELEHTRQNCDGGPAGPIGYMIKQVGTNAYGKFLTVENNTELLMTKEQPDGFEPYYGDDLSEFIEHVWSKQNEDDTYKPYHQPQIGIFITAHVRMVVRCAALIRPHDWLYADTDCVVFSSDVTKHLDTHKSRYGAWKIEDEGKLYRMITKKVYQDVETSLAYDPEKPGSKLGLHAKGLNVKRLTPLDFENWIKGIIPEQKQVHRQNFVEVMSGAEMFIDRTRKGTNPNRKMQSAKKTRA